MDDNEIDYMQRNYWLNYFNEYLFEHGCISQDVKDKISELINHT